MELSLIGLQNAGKSSLVNVLTTGTFAEDMIPTVSESGCKGSGGLSLLLLMGLLVARASSCMEAYTRAVMLNCVTRRAHVERPALHSQVGFNMKKITKGGVTIKMWDLGGQPRFRSLWERYCRGVQAIVFVVDAADLDNLEVRRAAGGGSRGSTFMANLTAITQKLFMLKQICEVFIFLKMMRHFNKHLFFRITVGNLVVSRDCLLLSAPS